MLLDLLAKVLASAPDTAVGRLVRQLDRSVLQMTELDLRLQTIDAERASSQGREDCFERSS